MRRVIGIIRARGQSFSKRIKIVGNFVPFLLLSSFDDRPINPVSENGNLRAHYTKTTVRAGEVLRLAAVFQDTRRAPVPSGISGVVSAPEGKSSRSSERDQYAQCLDSHGHELFAPLSARGEFYATCQSGSLDTGSDAVLYRVHQLARRDLPLRVSLEKTRKETNTKPETCEQIEKYRKYFSSSFGNRSIRCDWSPGPCRYRCPEITAA